MIEDMRARELGEKAQKAYVSAIKGFAGSLGRSPDTATREDLRAYQLHMADTGVTSTTFNARIVALRFFFAMTCGREDMKRHMQFRREPPKLPVVLSVEEVAVVLAATPGPGLKYRAAFSISYGGGLHASEVCLLKFGDIVPEARLRRDDSDRMLIRVDQGKGSKYGKIMPSPGLLDLLRTYRREARLAGWLFPGESAINPLSPRQLNRVFNAAKSVAGINRPATLHTLRQSFAPHLLEANTYVRVIQLLLAHLCRRTADNSRYVEPEPAHLKTTIISSPHRPPLQPHSQPPNGAAWYKVFA